MRLYDEIFEGTDGAFAQARCIWVPKRRGYFEGVKSVGEFSPERVDLRFAAFDLRIEGKQLHIEKYCEGDLALGGEIFSVFVLDAEGGGK